MPDDAIGLKRDPDRDGPCYEAWAETDDPEDAALPPEKFVFGERDEALAALRARLPAPEGTIRLDRLPDCATPAYRAWRLPVLTEAVANNCVHAYQSGRQFEPVAAAVAAAGAALVRGWTVDQLRRCAGLSRTELEAGTVDGVAAFVPASPATLARRAGARKGGATRRRNAEAKYAAEAARLDEILAAYEPAWTASVAYADRAWSEVQEALKAAGVRGVLRLDLADAAALYRLLLKRDSRRIPEYRAVVAAVGRAGRWRDEVLSRLPGWWRGEFKAMAEAKEARKAARRRSPEESGALAEAAP